MAKRDKVFERKYKIKMGGQPGKGGKLFERKQPPAPPPPKKKEFVN